MTFDMGTTHKTFELRYVGARFDGARLPVELLSDLAAFRDLLASFAKDRWRKLNLHRQRLPKGFDKSISLDLIGIAQGSAVPRLDWSRDVAQAMLPEFADEFEELVDHSYADLIQLFDEAGHGRFPPVLSSEHIRALDKFGSGLKDGERIEFLHRQGADGKVVYIDNYRRKELITRVRETYQARFDGIGKLVGLHLDGHIVVETSQHGQIKISVEPERVSGEFDGNTGADVQFSLQIELDNNDHLRNVIDVFDAELIDAGLSDNIKRCKARLNSIRCLGDGWNEGSGLSVTQAALKNAETFLSRRPFLAESYKIYPTEFGGILFEFEISGWDLSVELQPDGAVEMYGVEIDGAEEMGPQSFPELNEELFRAFDARTGR